MRSSTAISSGKRASPLAMPCVSEATKNPPLRPLAPAPTRSASRTTTSRAGSSALACSAAQSPVKPPPTMQRSAATVPASGGSAARTGNVSSQ